MPTVSHLELIPPARSAICVLCRRPTTDLRWPILTCERCGGEMHGPRRAGDAGCSWRAVPAAEPRAWTEDVDAEMPYLFLCGACRR